MTAAPESSPIPPRGELGWIDIEKCALLIHIGYDGVSHIQPGNGIGPRQAATWLREIAAQMEAKVTEEGENR